MSDKRIISKAFTEMAPHYEETMEHELQTFWGWSYDYFVDQIIEHTPIQEGDTILDIATGTAVIPMMFSKGDFTQKKIIGLDITPAMLKRAKKKIEHDRNGSCIHLSCGSAMVMPFPNESFDVITSGLATHHMDIPQVISEISRLLKPNGALTIADVGASSAWKSPPVQLTVRILAFFYYLPSEGFARARAESSAVSNVLTANDWENTLNDAGFINIEVNKLKTNRPFVPEPLVLRANKIAH